MIDVLKVAIGVVIARGNARFDAVSDRPTDKGVGDLVVIAPSIADIGVSLELVGRAAGSDQNCAAGGVSPVERALWPL